MQCHELLDSLNGFLDGDASPMLRAEIAVHVETCSPCRILVYTCKQTIHVYRSSPAPELPSALHRRLMERVRRERAGNPQDAS